MVSTIIDWKVDTVWDFYERNFLKVDSPIFTYLHNFDFHWQSYLNKCQIRNVTNPNRKKHVFVFVVLDEPHLLRHTLTDGHKSKTKLQNDT